jgi:hypothetical protein
MVDVTGPGAYRARLDGRGEVTAEFTTLDTQGARA